MLPFVALFAFTSCSKDDDDDKNDSGEVKLLKEIISEGDLSFYFEYDSENRITKITQTDEYDGDTYTATITYSSSIIICSWSDGYKYTYSLNEDGYLEKTTDHNEGTVIHYAYTNGLLSETWENEDKEESVQYKWQNGNLVEISDEYMTEKYTYGNVANKLNISDVDVDYLYYLPFKGMTNANFPIGYSDGYSTSTYEYTFDEEGYPTRMTETYDTGEKYVTRFTYYE